MKRIAAVLFIVFILPACAGISRGISNSCAQSLGSDWVVVQYRFDGQPINCWRLHGASVVNEPASDGIYWRDSTTGHLIHISGWYSRVQVAGGDYETAATLLGVDAAKCGCGKYPK